MTDNAQILLNPFGLVAFLALIVSFLAMGETAKKHIDAKGYLEYLIAATICGVFVYISCTKKRDGKIGPWFWIFLSALVALIAVKYWGSGQ